jgi:hypothetical protein
MREPTPTRSIRLTDQQTLPDTMIIGQQHIPLTAKGIAARLTTCGVFCSLLLLVAPRSRRSVPTWSARQMPTLCAAI